MITILHAGLLDRRLAVWAERGETAPARRVRRTAKETGDSRPHPFAARQGEIMEVLAAAGIYLTVPGRRRMRACAWLPTSPAGPAASSPLLAGEEPPAASCITPWRVPCILLPPGGEVSLLPMAGRHTLGPGVVIGADLAFWVDAYRLAAGLVVRQRFLPGLQIRDGVAHALWEPVPSAADMERVSALVSRMPPAACALTHQDGVMPSLKPREAVESFIGGIVDRVVRWGASRDIKRRAPSSPRTTHAADTIHHRWVQALVKDDGVMALSAAETADLAEQVRAWRAPISVTEAAPYRLSFRLEEPSIVEPAPRPGKGVPSWQVRYLVHPYDDPSLQVPVGEVWKSRKAMAAVQRRDADLRAFLLASLGQAAGICSRIEASLKASAPAGYALDDAGAHDFLSEKALLLEQAGFGVLLPSWWVRGRAVRRLEVRGKAAAPRLQAGAGLTLNRLITVNWEVALGGEPLTPAELEELARLKTPLVRVRGQWVEMTPEDIGAAMKVWKRPSERMSVRDLIHTTLGAREPAGGLAVAGITGKGAMGEFLERLHGQRSVEELAPPPEFVGTLRPYQVRGYSWLTFLRSLGFGACLADDMGLGKTIQALAFMQRERANGERRPVLLICPTSVVANWQKEAARFTPSLPVMVHHGVTRAKGSAFEETASEQAIVISSYALLHRDIDHLARISWAAVVLDEAQNVKNPETKQARAARTLKADFRIALTGTPVENNVGDLWSIMEFLNPGLLGSHASFRRVYFLPIHSGQGQEAAEKLKRITGPFVLRRLKTDQRIISDLPQKQEMKVFCGLTKEQASLYRAVAKEAEAALKGSEGIQRRGLVLATITKLKQVCNHPAQFLADGSTLLGRSGKLARLTEMLEELTDGGNRALVFTQFAEMGGMLQRHLQEYMGVEIPFLHGSVPKKRRDHLVDRFQSDGSPVFVLSLKAGGTGLNLTGANVVFHFDRWWNPAVEDQATDRVFRIGQTRDVQVYKFLCAGTMEEAIDDMIERKKDIADRVVGTGEGWLTELSNEELGRVFALRAEAMEE